MSRQDLGVAPARPADVLDVEFANGRFQKLDLPGGFVAGSPGTRRSMFAWGSAGESSWTGTTLNSCNARLPVRLPVKTTRWRLKIANIRPAGTTVAGNISFTGVWFSSAFYNLNTGDMNGWMNGTPSQVSTAFTSTGGAEVFTPWVTAANLQLNPYVMYMVSIGFTKSGTEIFAGSGGMFFTTVAADAATGVPSGLSAAANVPFDICLEYEYEGTNRNFLAIGDSLTEGTGALQNVNSWHQSLSMRIGSPVAMTANFGSASATWTTASQRRYQKILAGGYNIDAAIICLGSNDAFSAVALATYQTNMLNMISIVRNTLGIRDIYVANIAPRSFASGSASELRRIDYNNWYATQISGLGLAGVLDFNSALEASIGSLAIRAGSAAADNIHWTPQGNWRVANACSLNYSQ